MGVNCCGGGSSAMDQAKAAQRQTDMQKQIGSPVGAPGAEDAAAAANAAAGTCAKKAGEAGGAGGPEDVGAAAQGQGAGANLDANKLVEDLGKQLEEAGLGELGTKITQFLKDAIGGQAGAGGDAGIGSAVGGLTSQASTGQNKPGSFLGDLNQLAQTSIGQNVSQQQTVAAA